MKKCLNKQTKKKNDEKSEKHKNRNLSAEVCLFTNKSDVWS